MEVNLMETSQKNTVVMNIHVKTPPKIENHCAVICMEGHSLKSETFSEKLKFYFSVVLFHFWNDPCVKFHEIHDLKFKMKLFYSFA